MSINPHINAHLYAHSPADSEDYSAEPDVDLRRQSMRSTPAPEPVEAPPAPADYPDPDTDDGYADYDYLDERPEAADYSETVEHYDPATEAGQYEQTPRAWSGSPSEAPTQQMPTVAATGTVADGASFGGEESASGSSAASALLSARRDAAADPAEWGWRGRVNSALGTSLAPLPDSDEVSCRLAIEDIRRYVPGTFWSVAVVNPKGAQGKTSTTQMLSHTLGLYRGGGVVAWDSCESKGTLGLRVAWGPDDEATAPTTWDVLEHADQLCSGDTSSAALDAFVRRQPTNDEVLASDITSSRHAGMGAAECAAIAAVLRRHRSGVVIDTGNDDLQPNWQWVTAHADQLVIPITVRKDAAVLVASMLDGLIARGLGDKVAAAIVVVAHQPGADPVVADAITAQLHAAGIGADHIVEMPWEPGFDGGDRLAYTDLAPDTCFKYTLLAAMVAESVHRVCARRGRATDLIERHRPAAITRPAHITTTR